MSELEELKKELKESITEVAVVRGITQVVVGHCVSAIVTTLIHKVAPEATTKKQKIELYVAVYSMSHVASHHAAEYMKDSVEGKYKLARRLVNVVQGKPDILWKEATEEPPADVPDVVVTEVEKSEPTE